MTWINLYFFITICVCCSAVLLVFIISLKAILTKIFENKHIMSLKKEAIKQREDERKFEQTMVESYRKFQQETKGQQSNNNE